MRAMSALPRLILAVLALLGGSLATASQAAPAALVTIVEGEVALLRDSARLALVEGVALQADDLIELGPQGKLARLEFPDGALLDLGPGSRLLLSPRLGGDRARARAYLLTGWAKATAPKDVTLALLSPQLDLGGSGYAAVLALPGDGSAQVFAEAGEVQLRRGSAAAQALKSGEWLSLAGGKSETAKRPGPAFVQAMPRAFMDSLPARATRFQGKDVAPKRLAALVYADAQPWLDAPDAALRRANLPRWRPLARDAEFRRGLTGGLKSHPEWEPILFPPAPASAPNKATY